MKVKCIKTKVDKIDKDVFNANMQNYIEIGDVFYVFGVRTYKNTTYIFIFNGDHLFEVPIQLFEIDDAQLPSEWKINVFSDEEICFWPELFYEPDFIENFAEREEKERREFEILRAKMELS